MPGDQIRVIFSRDGGFYALGKGIKNFFDFVWNDSCGKDIKKNEEGVKAIRGKTRGFLYFILGSTWGLLNVAQ